MDSQNQEIHQDLPASSKNYFSKIITFFFIIEFTLFIFFLMLRNTSLSDQEPSTQATNTLVSDKSTTENISTKTPSINNNQKYITYENTDFGYRFSHLIDTQTATNPSENSVYVRNNCIRLECNLPLYVFTVRAYPNQELNSDFIEKAKEEWRSEYLNLEFSRETVTFQNQEAILLKHECYGECFSYYLENNRGDVLRITLRTLVSNSESNPEMDEIFSTFELTNPKATEDSDDWQVYENADYRFQLNYPNDFYSSSSYKLVPADFTELDELISFSDQQENYFSISILGDEWITDNVHDYLTSQYLPTKMDELEKQYGQEFPYFRKRVNSAYVYYLDLYSNTRIYFVIKGNTYVLALTAKSNDPTFFTTVEDITSTVDFYRL